MFYLTKIIGGKPRRYLYEAFRDKKSGKAKRRLVAYLGSCNSLPERVALIANRLKDAKAKEVTLLRVLEPQLSDLRLTGNCPSWGEIERMGLYNRRVSFVSPGAFAASKAIGPLKREIGRLTLMVRRLRSINPRLAVSSK